MFVQKGITINVGDTASVDVTLQVGTTTEAIEVHADASQLKSETSDLGTSMASKAILDLPLQLGGQVRSPVMFVGLTAGYTEVPGQAGVKAAGGLVNDPSQLGGFKLNGGQEGSVDILVDGASISLATPNVQMNYGVSVELVSEFKTATGSSSAEYGRISGGLINLVTRSGSNQLHGSAYDFLKNKALDANGWYSKYLGMERPLDTQNDFGGIISGPVFLPKLYNGKDKTFFVFSYEGFRFNTGSDWRMTQPLPACIQGDFSRLLTLAHPVQIFDPTTCLQGVCQAFAGNKIPQSRLSNVSQAYAKLLPLATKDDVINNATSTWLAQTQANLWTAKIDQYISEKQKISGSYSYDNRPTTSKTSAGDLFTNGMFQHTNYARFSRDYTLSPTLLNHFNAGFSRVRQEGNALGNAGQDIPGKIGLKGVDNTLAPCVGFDGISLDLACNDSFYADNSWQFNDSVSWIHGRHSLKFGVEARKLQFNTRLLQAASGQFYFPASVTSNGQDLAGTGNTVATFMLGAVRGGYQQFPADLGFRTAYYAGYVQDDFKATSKLTLNLGLRYELPGHVKEVNGRTSLLDPTLPNPGAGGILGALTFYGDGTGRNGKLYPEDEWMKAWGPRAGLAYQLTPTTVIRSAYGICYSPIRISAFGASGSQGFSGQYTFPTAADPTQPSIANWDNYNGPPAGVARPPYIDPAGANNQSPAMNLTDVARPGTVQNWSFDIQHQLGKEIMVDLGYVGAHGDHLQSFMRAPNQVPSQYQSKGDCLMVDINAQTTDPRCAGQTVVSLPYPGFGGSVSQALRPFPQYGDIDFNDNPFSPEPFGFYTYHALQAKLEKRFSQGLRLMANYTWSKNLTNGDSEFPNQAAWQGNGSSLAEDTYNNKLEKGLSQLDVPHRLVLAYTYELPIGPGKPFLNHRGVIGKVVGGWSISGIQQYHSGTPLIVNGNYNDGLFTGGWEAPHRANVVSGVDQKGYTGSFNFNASTIVNPAAFSNPANFTFGNAPRGLNVRELFIKSEDFTAVKKFSIFEKADANFRVDFFNAFNRHRYTGFNLNTAALQQYDAAGRNQFGIATNATGPRSIQAALKITF